MARCSIEVCTPCPETVCSTFPVNFHKLPHKMPLAGFGSGIFRVSFNTKRLLWHVHVRFHSARSHKACFPVLGSAFLLCAFICVLSYVLSSVCSHMSAFICMLLYVCFPYVCFNLCALICLLSFVISCVCSHTFMVRDSISPMLLKRYTGGRTNRYHLQLSRLCGRGENKAWL